LDALVTAAPDEPVLRLERGKARLMLGDGGGARDDFDFAWRHLGDGHIDLAGNQSLPGLWAEASLEAGDPEAVIRRLAADSDPRRSDVDIVLPFARALMDAETFDAARQYLEMAATIFPNTPDFAFLLSIVLDGQGQRRQAIATLESSVRPSCASGSCAAPPKHLPSLRALTRLLLEEDEVEQARAYLMHVIQARGGRLGAEEHRLSAEYFRRVGDEDRAQESEAKAKELAALGPDAVAEPLHSTPLTGRKQRVL
jgi:tetratricopeptide (TPR) repeat protein